MNSKRLGWLFLFILAFLVSGCSLKFSLDSAKTTSAGVYHTVKKGETLWRISQTYGSSVSAIKSANSLTSDTIEIGQRLLIPRAKSVRKVPSSTQTRPPRPSRAPIIKPVPKKTTGTPVFVWPISGTLLSTAQEAEREKKVTFEGKPGETLVTARAGQVFFVGETKGYSSTVIVDHLDGFYSVYGGDIETTAPKGKMLAEKGAIGKMITTREKPKLFFEIRRGTEPVNPMNYLKTN